MDRVLTRRELFRRVFGGIAAAVAAPFLPKPGPVFDRKYWEVNEVEYREEFVWCNQDWVLRISDNEEFGFGFSGFKEAAGAIEG